MPRSRSKLLHPRRKENSRTMMVIFPGTGNYLQKEEKVTGAII